MARRLASLAFGTLLALPVGAQVPPGGGGGAEGGACPPVRLEESLSAGELVERGSELFRRECWTGAVRLLEAAVRSGAARPEVWRLLGTARYLEGDPDGALRAWNRIGAPIVVAVRVPGSHRSPERGYRAAAGIGEGGLLDPRSRVLAERRLELLPGVARGRVVWEPSTVDEARVRLAVREIPPRPRGLPGLLGALAPGLVRRELTFVSGSPLRRAGAARALWRWQDGREAAQLAVGVPVGEGWRTIVHLAAGREEESASAPGGPGADPAIVRVEETSLLLAAGRWEGPVVRWRAGVRWDGRSGAPSSAGPVAAAEVRSAGGRASLIASAGLHRFTDGGGGFATGGLSLRLRTSARREGWVVLAEGAASSVGDDAPLPVWPGAGTGTARKHLLRAHPLLEGGVIRGPAFGRTLARGGAEIRRWGIALGSVSVAPALFVDAAAVWRSTLPGVSGAGREDGRWLVDAGAGLRLSLPGGAGLLRVDGAVGLADGAEAVSVGWEAPWPGVERFAAGMR